jgi:hypothetical protein
MKNEESNQLGADLSNLLNDKKGKHLEQVIEKTIADQMILKEVLKGLRSKKETFRYNCFKVLFQISKAQPLLLFSEWEYFLDLLDSPNSYHRMSAIYILSNLISVDTEKKFDLIFEKYFYHLDDPSMIVARYIAINAGKIAQAKPYLQTKITEKLLDIDNTHHEESRKDLIKHDIIQSFSEFLEKIPEKEKIFSFVEKQINSSSPKTRKAAQGFLKRFGKFKN